MQRAAQSRLQRAADVAFPLADVRKSRVGLHGRPHRQKRRAVPAGRLSDVAAAQSNATAHQGDEGREAVKLQRGRRARVMVVCSLANHLPVRQAKYRQFYFHLCSAGLALF